MASNTPIRWAGETPGIACRSSTLHSRKIATRTTLAILAVLAGVPWPCYAQAKGGKQEEPAFRAPFVLKLRIDNGHYYEQKFGKIPYVAVAFSTEDPFVSGGVGKVRHKPGGTSFGLASVQRVAQAGGVTFLFITRDWMGVWIANP